MTRSTRLLLSLVCALSALAIAAPATLAAKHHGKASGAAHGVVLSATHGTVRLVDSRHRVNDAHVRSAHGLRCGAVVAIVRGKARVTGRRSTVTFSGRVVRRSAHGLLLKLGDGSSFKLEPGHGRSARAGSKTLAGLRGLARGQTVLVTIAADGRNGGGVLAVKRVADPAHSGNAAQQPGAQQGGGDDEVDGVVSAIADDGSEITLDPGDDSDAVTIPVLDASLLNGVNVGDQVAVTTDAAGNATEIDVLDSSSADDGSVDDGGQQQGDTPDDSGDGGDDDS